MSGNESVGARILAAQAHHCRQIAADLAAARTDGASAEELADLEAQELAARKRYQELSVDIAGTAPRLGGGRAGRARRPWWRFW
jgi:hypothetical protein